MLADRGETDGLEAGFGGISLDEGDADFVFAGIREADDAGAVGFVNVTGGLLVLDFRTFRSGDGPYRAAFAFVGEGHVIVAGLGDIDVPLGDASTASSRKKFSFGRGRSL